MIMISFLIGIFIVQILLCLSCHCLPQVAPWNWYDAGLDEIREFLQNEIQSGRYVPVSNLPM